MKYSTKVFVGAMIVLIASSVSACQKKEPVGKNDVKVVKTEHVVASAPVTVTSLDKRVSKLEQRNKEVDAAVVARRKAAKGQFSPAPKYNPNFK